MSPAAVISLLEGAALVGTQRTVHSAGRGLQAPATQPLALRDVWHSIALLGVEGKGVFFFFVVFFYFNIFLATIDLIDYCFYVISAINSTF